MQQRVEHDPLAAGGEALGRGAWEEAGESFRRALAAEESAEAWEGLSWAAWWLGDAETLPARESAYRAHRAAGDKRGAGRMAVWLANDSLDFRGDPATGTGWLERARRLLEEEPTGSEHGWLLLLEGAYALEVAGDLEESARRARAATELGRELGVPDLEAVGLALEGEALTAGGRVVLEGALGGGLQVVDG
ncbi:MAG TPA: hypothetical protein VEQ61_10125, partial [Thermoleophilaceae bacterium]|nr:hypothetical protein [Thermoleophilaceae bacterium]